MLSNIDFRKTVCGFMQYAISVLRLVYPYPENMPFKLCAWVLRTVYKALMKRFAGELPLLTNPSILNWYVTIQLFLPSPSLKGLNF